MLKVGLGLAILLCVCGIVLVIIGLYRQYDRKCHRYSTIHVVEDQRYSDLTDHLLRAESPIDTRID